MFIQEKILLGKKIILETGIIATQSDGSVLLRIGNTILLSTVVFGKEIKHNCNFIPLTIDYREKYFAVGKIPGGFIKREGKPSDQEILTMRIVDRLIRPFLPKELINEIQIIITLLSYDYKVLPDGLVGLASSAALLISGIPFKGPVSQIRLARINNKLIINPNINQIKESDINLIIGGSLNSIIMIDGEMKEITNKDFIKIIEYSHKAIIKLINLQIKFFKKVKKYINIKKIKIFKLKLNNLILKKKIKYLIYHQIYKIIKNYKRKKDRNKKFKNLLKKIIYLLDFNNEDYIKKYFNYFKKKIIRKLIINENIRLDGRQPKDIRNIWGIINYLPGVHGSAIFTRGETQSLSTVTLGSSLDVNKIDNVVIEYNEKFYLHYNFHPFSTGEVKLITGISRREIGHGTLAKKALKNIIPLNNPYTIRIVSDILESNGSSSMATVCAASLALMDAGIKINNPVAGISMGLINYKKKIKILYDILGEEDHYGDMDLKITRSIKGITACQMDIKNIKICNINILKKILKHSKKGILNILNIMNNILSKPKNNIKSTAPILTLIKIPKQYIRIIIGSGGKTIQEIQSSTDTNIIITEKNNQGIIEIFGKKNNIDKAIKIIKNIIFIPKIGNIYKGKVISIKRFGVFIELSKGVEGLLPYINLNINIGDIIKVKYLGIDINTGKIKLSLNNEKIKN
ncbi:polyribonucleotide nucleotidyltransferase [Candidatus Shikimatogenerans bostrichidophilus]|uniref:polyribonucleotide nucleotidyltransferase n=1 Tax=Candidatus Shikimatogenerans bostrichidophilus TaxID=2943807 RepID=UPI0029666371